MTACTAYGFARECSARQKCYPIPDENESGGGQGFQCLCNRSLLFHGTECASYHKVFMVTSVIRIIALVYITQQGSQAVYCLLQRRRTRSTSWAAIISASATLVVGATLSVDAIFNGVFRPHIEGNLWYNTYGRLIVQELVMFCLVLSCLSISLYFFEKVQQFRIIRKKTNTLVKATLISFQVAFPTLSILAWLFSGQRTAKDIDASFRAGVAGFSLFALRWAGTRVRKGLLCPVQHMDVAETVPVGGGGHSSSLTVASLRRRGSALDLFTQRYLQCSLAAVLFDVLWTFCDKNYRLVPALFANLAMALMNLALCALSLTTYGFLCPRAARRDGPPPHPPPSQRDVRSGNAPVAPRWGGGVGSAGARWWWWLRPLPVPGPRGVRPINRDRSRRRVHAGGSGAASGGAGMGCRPGRQLNSKSSSSSVIRVMGYRLGRQLNSMRSASSVMRVSQSVALPT
mmetsp:Transcript_15460/g.24385  ORF Transcript_15460/g.24385 Transcript_15460/m.24385 type:complete len:458 (+) Transcript_15460:33-1406(+)